MSFIMNITGAMAGMIQKSSVAAFPLCSFKNRIVGYEEAKTI